MVRRADSTALRRVWVALVGRVERVDGGTRWRWTSEAAQLKALPRPLSLARQWPLEIRSLAAPTAHVSAISVSPVLCSPAQRLITSEVSPHASNSTALAVPLSSHCSLVTPMSHHSFSMTTLRCLWRHRGEVVGRSRLARPDTSPSFTSICSSPHILSHSPLLPSFPLFIHLAYPSIISPATSSTSSSSNPPSSPPQPSSPPFHPLLLLHVAFVSPSFFLPLLHPVPLLSLPFAFHPAVALPQSRQRAVGCLFSLSPLPPPLCLPSTPLSPPPDSSASSYSIFPSPSSSSSISAPFLPSSPPPPLCPPTWPTRPSSPSSSVARKTTHRRPTP